MALMNFRDLGGMSASGGQLRRGLVYRAGDLSRLGDDEVRHLVDELEIGTYVDMRSSGEIEELGKPEALLSKGVTWMHEPIELADEVFIRARPPSASDWTALYVRGLERWKDSYARILGTFASAEGSVVFGCAAGKDRTGIAAALFLSTLGVPDALIAEDYARTTRGLEPHLDAFERYWRDDPSRKPRIVTLYFVAAPEIMQGFLSEVRKRWGDAASLLKLAPEIVTKLRDRYVERG